MSTKHNFKKTDKVVYSGGAKSETGTVTSTNQSFVFVDFSGTGVGKPCNPKDLKLA